MSSDETPRWSVLYAVVLEREFGYGTVRWNGELGGWVDTARFSRSAELIWGPISSSDLEFENLPSNEDIKSAGRVLEEWLERHERNASCANCEARELKMHYIAPDVFGEPKIYCVQRPDYTVVDSRGGSGKVKHWGSRGGCQSVAPFLDFKTSGELGLWEGAAYLFGEPLSAYEVINRDWCSRCRNTAFNILENASAKREGESNLTSYYVDHSISYLGRLIQQYVGEG